MREIKFRAWDKYAKQMLVGTSHLCTWFDSEKKGQYELMQFTGLLDKNGVEIFEGDIVEFNKSGKYFAVKWNERGGCWSVSESVFGKASSSSEVIGNIYENPDLCPTN